MRPTTDRPADAGRTAALSDLIPHVKPFLLSCGAAAADGDMKIRALWEQMAAAMAEEAAVDAEQALLRAAQEDASRILQILSTLGSPESAHRPEAPAWPPAAAAPPGAPVPPPRAAGQPDATAKGGRRGGEAMPVTVRGTQAARVLELMAAKPGYAWSAQEVAALCGEKGRPATRRARSTLEYLRGRGVVTKVTPSEEPESYAGGNSFIRYRITREWRRA